MRLKRTLFLTTALSTATLFSAPFSGAQQKASPVLQANFAYDVTREAVVQGTVLSYTAASTVAPIGPHAQIQTASGVVDVQLGSAQVMKQNDIFLEPGDSVKIVGESMNFERGPVFLARILRKGNQIVTLRNINGIPIMAKPVSLAKPRVIVGVAR
jgi:hypothetical protein